MKATTLAIIAAYDSYTVVRFYGNRPALSEAEYYEYLDHQAEAAAERAAERYYEEGGAFGWVESARCEDYYYATGIDVR